MVSNKFVEKAKIKTFEYIKCDDKKIHKFIDFIQCNYYDSDNIITLNDKKSYNLCFLERKYPSYISFYQEIITTSSNQNTIVLGCITSRYLLLSFDNIKIPIYYLDYICVHRCCYNIHNKLITNLLIQTHEYNQRINNTMIKVSLLEQNKNPLEGVIYLVKYSKLLFQLPQLINDIKSLPQNYVCYIIQKENIEMVNDFLLRVSSIFRFTSISDIENIYQLITNNEMYVYCLCQGNDIFAYYFFKNSQKQYEHIGNIIEFIGSYNNTRSNELFYIGFIYALSSICKKMNYRLLLYQDISHNTILLGQFVEFYTLLSQQDNYYYLYNYIIPSSPLSNRECFILV